MKFPMNLRGVFAGSGVEAFSNPTMAETILDLVIPNPTTNTNAKNASVLYVGTATYDLPLFRDKQTNCFLEKGCIVRSLDLAFDGEAGDSGGNLNSNSNEKRLDEFTDPAYLIEEWADVIVVSGGNTLFAVDRWQKLEWVVPAFRKAMDRGCVMSGGSAGAICWFDSGHSDSMDPDSYQDAMLEKYSPESTTTESTDNDDNNNNNNNMGEEAFDGKEETKKKWNYIRVPGLGFVPGLICCPHFDLTQSNGLLRANDFDAMLLRTGTAVLLNSKEPNTDVVMGLGIDHYAALVVTGDSNYRIFQFDGKAGSVAEATTKVTSSLDKDNVDDDDDDDDGYRFSVDDDGTSKGVPGIWIKRVVEEENEKDSSSARKKLVVKSKVCPPKGKLQDLFGLVGVSAEVADPLSLSSSLSAITKQTFFDDGSDPDNMHHIQLCRTENPSWNKPSSAV